jgi:hypothetical protein
MSRILKPFVRFVGMCSLSVILILTLKTNKMVHVILTHEVKDFSVWKKAYDEGEPLRTTFGIKMTGVYTSVDYPTQVTLVGECASADVVYSFMSQPELKAAMQEAGVISEPDMKVVKKV